MTTTEYILAYRACFRATELRYSIRRVDIEVLNAIQYVTGNKGLECSVKSVMPYLISNTLYNAYSIVRKLVNEGFIENTGKKGYDRRFYVSLTDKGKEVISFLNSSMGQRIASFNDDREVRKKKIRIRVKKNKGSFPGASPLPVSV